MVNDIEQRLNRHDLAISQLEANTKWLYKYGGVGGKGGNGTSSDGSNYNIYCEFDNIPINNNDSKIYSAGKHKLKVTITKHGGLSYNVKPIVQSQANNSSTINANPSSAVLSLETTYTKEFTLTINENSNVIISVTSSDGEPKSFMFSIITNPYIFELTYNRDNGTPYNVVSMNNSELMINELSNNGFNIVLNYNIGVDATISYITKSSIQSINDKSGDITNVSGKIEFNIDKSFLVYENSGLYNFSIILTIKEKNSLPYEYPISCSFFLIPSTLFLLIYPEDDTKTIYYSSDGNEPVSSENTPLSTYYNEYSELVEKDSLTEEEQTRLSYIKSEVSYFNKGIIGLVGKIYFGGNQQRTFTLLNDDESSIKVYPNDKEESEDIILPFTSVTERKAFNFGPSINYVNKNKLVFTVKDSNQTPYEFVYYLYTSQESNALTWIDKDIVIDKENYWRNGIASNAFSKLQGKSYIDTYSNSLTDILLSSSLEQPNGNVDLFISLGIQYNAVNNDDKPIITFSSNLNDLVIYQNKITYLGQTCNIYIPKEENYNQGLNSNYHLLTISLRKISYKSNDTYYEFIVYIDGTIEGAFTGYLTTVETFDSIKFNPCNVSLNLIELSYFGNTSLSDKQRQFTESDIDRYWYSYCENYRIPNSLYDSNTLPLLDIFKKINYEVESTNLYSLQNAQITSIAKAIDIPVMIMSISTTTNIGALASYGGDVLTWFTNAASETTPSLQVDSIYWSPGKADFKQYKLSEYSQLQGAYWYIVIQGSSTKGRKVKNLNLGIKNNGDNAVLFTPNFKKITSSMSNSEAIAVGNSSFLPEQIFTLKADIVDSSHCNNVSIGKFVNDATPKFSNAQQPNSKYSNYIKNCLTGFPFLLFFEIQNNDENEYYYVGIYNFNLGRNSYFNLGYNSFEGLDNYIENVSVDKEKEPDRVHELSEGFGIYVLDDHYTQHIKSLFVTEVQSGSIQKQTHEGGGGNVYDFSQFNPSILGIDGNNSGMFGDFENDTTISANLTTTLPKFVKSVAKAGAYIFMNLKKNIDSDILTSNHPVGDYNVGYSRSLDNTATGKFISVNHVPDFLLEAYRDNTITGHPVYFRKPNDPLYQGILKDANINFDFTTYLDGNHTTTELLQDLLNALPKTTNTGWLETAILEITARVDGENETQPVPLDYISLVWYYVICMAMGLVDSVCKNLNLKSWDASNDSLGKMYTAFYDMDTALGRDNFGRAVSYFAFSDYWTNNFSESGVDEIDPITIYRDFFPQIDDNSEIIGYDIPSSYLFAIAKYAQLFINPTIWNLNGFQSPQDIWYNLRNYQNGKLRNAQYFIDTYFNNDIKKIPEILINYNYRFKYFWCQEESFNSDELGSFHGKGVYSLKEWLSNRLHILDLYFNLCAAKDFIQYYDESDKTWKNINNTLTELASNQDINVLSNVNSDVLIFKNAFATENQITKSSISNIYLTVKAPELSPFVIITDPSTENKFVYRYLLNNPNKYYRIHTTNNGSQETIFGGSVLWTEVQEAGYFIDKNTLNCNSVNLNYLKSTLGICSNYNLNTPSLHTLILNNTNYTGSFEVSRTTGKLPNLNSLDLSYTSMSKIDIINSNIQYIYITNANINKLNIRDCKNIQKIDLSNSVFNTINIQYPWNLEKESNVLNLSSTRFNSINIGESTIDGTVFNEIMFDDSNSNTEESEIVKKSINAFNAKNVKINNFQHLQSLIISPNVIEELHITNSNLRDLVEPENATVKNYIYVDQKVLHLENLVNLKAISLENTLGFTQVILPNKDIKLLAKAFYQTDLEYIDFEDGQNENHKLVLCDNTQGDCKIFYNSRFTLTSSNGINLNFTVEKDKNTSLEEIFALDRFTTAINTHNGVPNITYENAVKFINGLGNKEKVTSLFKAFFRQENLRAYINTNTAEYTAGDNLEDKIYLSLSRDAERYTYVDDNNKAILMSFSGYYSLKTIAQCFEYCNINFINKNLFENVRQVDSKLELAIENSFEDTVLKYIHIDAFGPISGCYKTFLFVNYKEDGPKRFGNDLIIYDESGILSTVNLRKLIFGTNDTDIYTSLETLSGFNISSSSKLDFSSLFTPKDVDLQYIYDVFTNIDQSENKNNICVDGVNTLNYVGLKDLQNLTIFKNSFIAVSTLKLNEIKTSPALVDICNLFNWDTQAQILFDETNKYAFNFYKKVDLDADNWNETWEKLFRNIEIKKIDSLFSNTVFYTSNDQNPQLVIPAITGVQSNIIDANYLFENSTMYVNNEETGLILTDNTLTALSRKIESINNLFANCVLCGQNNYPIPDGLLNSLTNLTSAKELFKSTSIIGSGNNKTYEYDNDDYKCEIIVDDRDNISYIYGNDSYKKSYLSTGEFKCEGYPILPPSLLSNLSKLQYIDGLISYSDFIGYIPNTLLSQNIKLKSLSSIFEGCKVFPQLIKEYDDNNIGIYNPPQLTGNDKLKIFTFIPDNFLTSEHKDLISSCCDNLFSFYLTVSRYSPKRVYLFSNNSLPMNSLIKLNSIQPLYHPESKIILQWKNDGNTTAGNIDNWVSTMLDPYINIYFNFGDDNSNTYEGLSSDILSSMQPNSYIIDDKLSGLIYGYVFKKGTILNKQFIYNMNNILILKAGLQVAKPGDPNTQLIYPYAQKLRNIILPSVIYHSYINYSDFPARTKLWDEITNIYSLNKLYSFINGINVNTSNIDVSFIDNITTNDLSEIHFNDSQDGDVFAGWTYNDIVYIEKTEDVSNIELALDHCKHKLEELVYSNYLLLFNEWKKEQIQRDTDALVNGEPDETKGKSSIQTDININMYNDNDNTQVRVKPTKGYVSDPVENDYLHRIYNVKLSAQANGRWIITEVKTSD